MKKVLAIILSLVMVFTILPVAVVNVSALDSSGKCGDNVFYSFDSETGKLTISGTGNMYDGYYYLAFHNDSSIKSVVIENGVTSIGSWAFEYCESLTSITIPNSVTNIGWDAFFMCKSLKNITIPNSVKEIGNGAFEYCESLTSITIPNSVTSIGDWAFSGCKSLKNINVSKSNKKYTSANGVVFDKDKTRIISYPAGKKLSSYKIQNRIKSVEEGAFSGCIFLTKIVIPDSFNCINKSAFSGCSSLESVIMPDSIKSIDANAFSHCTSLTSITLPDNVKSIGVSAFESCTSLMDIKFGKKLKKINTHSFYNCKALKNVYIKDLKAWCNMKLHFDYINYSYSHPLYYAHFLYLNNKLITNLIIPKNIKKINPLSFNNCFRIKKVYIPKTVKNIEKCAFYGTSSSTDLYYGGTKSEFFKIYPTATDDLKLVNIHYNAKLVTKNAKKATYFANGYSGDGYINGKLKFKGFSIPKLKLATPKMTVTAGKKLFKVKYTKVKDATGFQLRYRISGKWIVKNFNTKKSVTKTINKLKKGKKYIVQIRAFVKSGKKTAYSSWTKAKKVKIK